MAAQASRVFGGTGQDGGAAAGGKARGPDHTVSRRGKMLLHPAAIAAVLTLILNDHVMKEAFPGFVTGKLSDVAGLVFFPILLAELTGGLLRREAARLLPAAAALTTVAFALVKLTSAGATAYAWALGATQWSVGLLLPGHAAIQPVSITMDATDLVGTPRGLDRPVYRAPFAVPARGFPGNVALPSRPSGTGCDGNPHGGGCHDGDIPVATPAPPTGVVVSEQLNVASDQIAVRHLTWSVAKPGNPFTKLRLEVSIRAGSDKRPGFLRIAHATREWTRRQLVRTHPDRARQPAVRVDRDARWDGLRVHHSHARLDGRLPSALQRGRTRLRHPDSGAPRHAPDNGQRT